MGVFWSNGITCDKKIIKTLIDEENWFSATLIEYNALSKTQNNNLNNTLPRMSKKQNIKPNLALKKNIFTKTKKCFGRITVQTDCIIFQGINCDEIMKAIISQQEKSPKSPDSTISESPDAQSYNRSLCHSASSASTTSGGYEFELSSMDRLHTFVWPIESVRHFGFRDEFFSFDSGRCSSTGEGRFTFKIKKLILFLSMFQTAKEKLYLSKPSHLPYQKYAQSHQISADYYNVKSADSYHISQCNLAVDLPQIKTVSKSTELFFNDNNNHSSLSPPLDRKYQNISYSSVKYSNIDFSKSYVNVENVPYCRRRSRSVMKTNGDDSSIHYLTICENQTKAVEKVLKRLG